MSRAEDIELAIATMPVKNSREAETVAWLLVNTAVVAVIDAALAGREDELADRLDNLAVTTITQDDRWVEYVRANDVRAVVREIRAVR